MSDFVSHDILPDLWEEILQRHWTFLETEESIQKLEERKKLEGCLKEFLCVVPHDRKFFLPETAHVLRKSIREMDEFTAYKAIVGFESISQYANNLFTKPWRKEFRVLKTYSGFYQHEVKLNLLDSEKMFEAMGYRRLSNEILVLDGPICPDQVTNVSRDAMAAYVECQIIKHIYSGLLALGVNCSWQDVYHYRETHVGGTTQAIKSLAYAVQDRRLRKEKHYNANDPCYAAAQKSQQCVNCGPYYQKAQSQHIMPHINDHCAVHGSSNLLYNGAANHMSNKLKASYPTSSNYQQHPNYMAACPQQQLQHPQMTHSRSLEHYNEPHASLPHRHSFDQQQGCIGHQYQQIHPMQQQHLYESPYDCIDGASMGSGASYSMVADANPNSCSNFNTAYTHPYNISGNRVPLPFNISNQLNTHYTTPTVICNGIKGTTDGYANVMDNTNNYASIGKTNTCNLHGQKPLPSLPPTRQHFINKDKTSLKQQRPLPPDQLIDFDDRAVLLRHDYNAHHMHTSAPLDYERERLYEGRDVSVSGVHTNIPIYSQPVVSTDHMGLPSQNMLSGSYDYARPIPRSSRTKQQSTSNAGMMVPSGNMTDKRLRNTEVSQDFIDNNIQLQTELNTAINNLTLHPSTSRRKITAQNNERDTSDHTSYDSTNLDDFVTVYPKNKQLRSPTQAIKNQDGVGSYESWNYVFQNLERSGYTKDLGEREDLLMQGLDLEAAANAASANAGGTTVAGTADVAIADVDKRREIQTKTIIKPVDKMNTKQEKLPAITNATTPNIMARQISSTNTGATKKIVKSALKTTNKTASITTNNDNKFTNNNAIITNKSNNNNMTNNTNKGSTKAQTNGVRNGTAQKQTLPTTTQVIVTGPNEWSCQYCTFLNPNTKRVCEMCCRSKDFQLDAVVISHAPTCV